MRGKRSDTEHRRRWPWLVKWIRQSLFVFHSRRSSSSGPRSRRGQKKEIRVIADSHRGFSTGFNWLLFRSLSFFFASYLFAPFPLHRSVYMWLDLYFMSVHIHEEKGERDREESKEKRK